MNPQHLTPEQRRERGTKLCKRLAQDVAAVAPKGIGAWPTAWEMTAPTDEEFMEALTAWEVDPTPGTLDRTRTAYRAVVDAWRAAASAWHQQQRAER